MFIQGDEGLKPASGYYTQRDVQVSQTGSNGNKVKIPNSLKDSGQARSDGTYSPYTNIGSSNDEDAVAFLSFDVSSIPKDATIRSAALEFKNWEMVGTPFSKLGCLNIFPAQYRLLGSQSYSSIVSFTPYGKICSSGDLNSPLSFPDLTKALRASLNQGKFQLRLQFERSALSPSSGQVMLARGSTASADNSGDNFYSRTSISPIESLSSSGSSQQTFQDMGLDRSFLESDLLGDNKISNYGYILLSPGVNLSKLGITPEMVEKAIDPGQVSVAANYMYEKASVSGVEIPNQEIEAERCPTIYDETGAGELYNRCYDCDNDNVCDHIERDNSDTSSSSGCPEGYCPDSNNDGVCDPSGNVIGPAHIGWLSRDPAAGSEIQGRHVEVPRSTAPNCCRDSNNNGKCDEQEGGYDDSGNQGKLYYVSSSSDILKIGVVWLDIDYSQPQVAPACDQRSCQAQSKAIGSAYTRDGKIYQKYIKCNCVDGTCRCENYEKEIGMADKSPQEVITVPGWGSISFKVPDPASLISTSQWGEVPANQVFVALHDGGKLSDVEALADSLGGQVIGYFDYINLYQIETSGKTEADLRRAISRAEANSAIDLAFPNQKLYPDRSPLQDPVYAEGKGRSQEIAGVQQAWDLIEAAGLNLSVVNVSVSDDGLYRGCGEFDGAVRIDTDDPYSSLDKPLPDYPIEGSHGTGVTNVLAADPDNGGIVGIASEPLRDKLGVKMINIYEPPYSKSRDFWESGWYMALMEAVDSGSTILSCSWGNRETSPSSVTEFRNFLEKTAKRHPEVLFVCSAGNENESIDGSQSFPSGQNLSNIITVGSVWNNGRFFEKGLYGSNRASANFEVTLAAPGEQVVYGRDSKGEILNSYGGTSKATPFVTAAAAIIRSLDPSLNASEIKVILAETARRSVDVGDSRFKAPKELGGGVLAIDLAVERVIANQKNQTGV